MRALLRGGAGAFVDTTWRTAAHAAAGAHWSAGGLGSAGVFFVQMAAGVIVVKQSSAGAQARGWCPVRG